MGQAAARDICILAGACDGERSFLTIEALTLFWRIAKFSCLAIALWVSLMWCIYIYCRLNRVFIADPVLKSAHVYFVVQPGQPKLEVLVESAGHRRRDKLKQVEVYKIHCIKYIATTLYIVECINCFTFVYKIKYINSLNILLQG